MVYCSSALMRRPAGAHSSGASNVVLVCLSRGSINKAGYLQKEIKIALDVADEQPEGRIFLIPLRLEECDVPDRLRRWQRVDLFKSDGTKKLMLALRLQAENLGLGLTFSTPALGQNKQLNETTFLKSSSSAAKENPDQLRAALLHQMGNFSLRGRYLEVRTPGLLSDDLYRVRDMRKWNGRMIGFLVAVCSATALYVYDHGGVHWYGWFAAATVAWTVILFILISVSHLPKAFWSVLPGLLQGLIGSVVPALVAWRFGFWISVPVGLVFWMIWGELILGPRAAVWSTVRGEIVSAGPLSQWTYLLMNHVAYERYCKLGWRVLRYRLVVCWSLLALAIYLLLSRLGNRGW